MGEAESSLFTGGQSFKHTPCDVNDECSKFMESFSHLVLSSLLHKQNAALCANNVSPGSFNLLAI